MSDSSQICDYRFLLIVVTNQSTIIEYYRLIDEVFDDRFQLISYTPLFSSHFVAHFKCNIPCSL